MASVRSVLGAITCALGFTAGAHADTLNFICDIDGAQAGACAGTGSAGIGAGSFTLDTATGQVDYIIDYGGLSGNETAAHVHGAAPACANAGVVYALPAGAPKTGSTTLSAQQMQDMIDGLHYVNIHSTVEPAGEIRGQILLDQSPRLQFGMLHMPLGQAQLDASGGTLTVSNIGSSGKDGVWIDLGEAEGSGMTFQPPIRFQGLPPGEPVVRWQHSDRAVDVSGNPVGEPFTAITVDGSTIDLTADFSSLGVSSVRLSIFDQGAPVLSMVVPNGIVAQLSAGPVGDPQLVSVVTTVEIDRFSATHLFAGPITISPPGLAPVVGDAYELVAAGPPSPLGAIDLSTMQLAGTGAVTLSDEALLKFGHPHRALGGVQFDASSGTLTVDNLGSSGKDGVSIDLGDSDAQNGFDALLLPLDLPSPQDELTIAATGRLQGGPPQFLGEARLANDGLGGYEVFADYGAIGSSQVRIEVLDLGTLTGSLVVPGGLLGQLVPGPQGLGLSKCGKFGGGGSTCLVSCYENPFELFLPGEPQPLVGNELRLLAENPTSPIESIIDFEIRSSEPFTIIDEIIPGAVNPIVFGIEHEDIGSAQLQLDPSGNLVVSNIGSSGKDGVSIDLGEPEAVSVTFELFTPLPVGSVFSTGIRYVCGTTPTTTADDCLIWEIVQSGQGAHDAQVTPARGIGSSGCDLVAYDAGGNPVYTVTDQNGPAFVIPCPPLTTTTAGRGADGVGPDWKIVFDVPAAPTFAGQPAPTPGVVEIHISHQFVPGGYCADYANGFVLECTRPGTPSPQDPFVTIHDVLLGQFQALHEALGEAELSSTCGTLTVSNLGSSGKDGITIDLGDTDSDLPSLEGIDQGVAFDHSTMPLEAGDFYQITGRGTVATGSVEPVGFVSVLHEIGEPTVHTDLTPFNATSTLIQVYDDGTLVGGFSFPGTTGQVANLQDAGFGPPALSGAGMLPAGGSAGDGYILKFPVKCIVSWPAAPLAGTFPVGDEMHIIAEGAATTGHSALTGLDINIGGQPALTFTGIDITDDCPADIDGNGSVGFTDLNAVLGTWGTCPAPCPADLNGDGSVGFVDLNVVLSAWGPC